MLDTILELSHLTIKDTQKRLNLTGFNINVEFFTEKHRSGSLQISKGVITILVNPVYMCNVRDVVFTVAHEMRHLYQIHQDVSLAYSMTPDYIASLNDNEYLNLPIEQDANRFASDYVNENTLKLDLDKQFTFFSSGKGSYYNFLESVKLLTDKPQYLF